MLLSCSGDLRLAAAGAASDDAAPGYVVSGNRVELGSLEGGELSLKKMVSGDLNNDGVPDRAVVLVNNSSGSGVLYYLNVFLGTDSDGWQFVAEEFLGDRIVLQEMSIYGEGSVSAITGVPIHSDDYGQLMLAYYTYKVDQAFSEKPALFLTRHWKFEAGDLQRLENY
ncbi:MAG: hypothetical protein AseanaTS_27460 [Candidatus Pelagadaptatus aseana]